MVTENLLSTRYDTHYLDYAIDEGESIQLYPCPVQAAARIIGLKWSLQIVHHLLRNGRMRFCELQEALGGVNPSTLSSRLKMLEEEGLVHREEISTIPPHVEYSLTEMGQELAPVIREVARWGNRWLCRADRGNRARQMDEE